MSTTVDPIQMGTQIGTALASAIQDAKARMAQRQRWATYAQYFRAIGRPKEAQVFEFAIQSSAAAFFNPALQPGATPTQPAAQPAAVPASRPAPAPQPAAPAFNVSTAAPEAIAKRADELHGSLDLAMQWIGQPKPAQADVERAETLVQQGQALYDAVSSRAEQSQDHDEVMKLFNYQVRRMGNALPGFRWQVSVARARLTP